MALQAWILGWTCSGPEKEYYDQEQHFSSSEPPQSCQRHPDTRIFSPDPAPAWKVPPQRGPWILLAAPLLWLNYPPESRQWDIQSCNWGIGIHHLTQKGNPLLATHIQRQKLLSIPQIEDIGVLSIALTSWIQHAIVRMRYFLFHLYNRQNEPVVGARQEDAWMKIHHWKMAWTDNQLLKNRPCV